MALASEQVKRTHGACARAHMSQAGIHGSLSHSDAGSMQGPQAHRDQVFPLCRKVDLVIAFLTGIYFRIGISQT